MRAAGGVTHAGEMLSGGDYPSVLEAFAFLYRIFGDNIHIVGVCAGVYLRIIRVHVDIKQGGMYPVETHGAALFAFSARHFVSDFRVVDSNQAHLLGEHSHAAEVIIYPGSAFLVDAEVKRDAAGALHREVLQFHQYVPVLRRGYVWGVVETFLVALDIVYFYQHFAGLWVNVVAE